MKEALTKLQGGLEAKSMVDYLNEKAREQDIPLNTKAIKGIELLKKYLQRAEILPTDVFVKFIPLAAPISNQDIRRDIEWAFLSGSVSKEIREGLRITDRDVEEAFNLAYRRLEDFIALAG